MSVDAILKEVAALPVGERLDLLDRIWEQYLEPDLVVEPNDELKAELDRRIAAADTDPTNVFTWEEVQEYVKRKK